MDRRIDIVTFHHCSRDGAQMLITKGYLSESARDDRESPTGGLVGVVVTIHSSGDATYFQTLGSTENEDAG